MIIFDLAGNLIIADRLNNRVRKVSTSGIISTIAGTGTASYNGDGGQASLAGLNGPFGVNLDGSGNLYIADYGNNVIRKVNTSGVITTIAGTGLAGFSGDGGQATAAKLNEPNIGIFDAAGNLYVSDASNNRVRKITNVDVATGVGNFFNINNTDVVIYPNPSNGVFSIRTSLMESQIDLFSLTGIVVLSQTMKDYAHIDIGNLPSGMYNLMISNTQGVFNRRIIICN
jgi:sugar lactone lactonase YvrE